MLNANELDDLKKSKILIVDDIETNIILLKRMLELEGYFNIISETESLKVMEIVQREAPDILLLDLYMPKKSGFEVIDELVLAQGENIIPIIVITAQDSKDARIQALNRGARDFISKPFDRLELLLRIRNMLEIRKLYQQITNDNRNLEEKVRERTKELQELQMELMDRLLRAAEFRDSDTGEHIVRIGKMSRILAEALDMDQKFINAIETASMMHDIGKIAIPDAILLSKDQLTQEEWQVMRTHTQKGAKLLSGSRFTVMQMAERIALYHHEKWNGTGYPKGLSGSDIPIESRIVAICDVFDALMTKRSYKQAIPLTEVLEMIQTGSGQHFDPEITKVFFNTLDSLMEVYNG